MAVFELQCGLNQQRKNMSRKVMRKALDAIQSFANNEENPMDTRDAIESLRTELEYPKLLSSELMGEGYDVISRSKRILESVDTYHERPDRMNRNSLRQLLMSEFEDAAMMANDVKYEGWKPIETAPASSNHVLSFSTSGNIKIETGHWLRNMLHQSKIDGDDCNYTHWMPLPKAPI